MHLIVFRMGLRPRPHWGAYSALPYPLAGSGGRAPGEGGGRGRRGKRSIASTNEGKWKALIHRTGSTQRIALLSDEDSAMATCNTYSKFGKIWTCGFSDMRADRATDRQTYIHIQDDRYISHRYRRGEVEKEAASLWLGWEEFYSHNARSPFVGSSISNQHCVLLVKRRLTIRHSNSRLVARGRCRRRAAYGSHLFRSAVSRNLPHRHTCPVRTRDKRIRPATGKSTCMDASIPVPSMLRSEWLFNGK